MLLAEVLDVWQPCMCNCTLSPRDSDYSVVSSAWNFWLYSLVAFREKWLFVCVTVKSTQTLLPASGDWITSLSLRTMMQLTCWQSTCSCHRLRHSCDCCIRPVTTTASVERGFSNRNSNRQWVKIDCRHWFSLPLRGTFYWTWMTPISLRASPAMQTVDCCCAFNHCVHTWLQYLSKSEGHTYKKHKCVIISSMLIVTGCDSPVVVLL